MFVVFYRLRYHNGQKQDKEYCVCAKEGIGKYDMWYGVVCKAVMSSCMSVIFSLAGGRDTVSFLAITAISVHFFVATFFRPAL